MTPQHQPLKVAFLGGAINSAVGNAHYSAIAIDHKYQLVSGCFSRDEVRNNNSAAFYGIPEGRTYSNLSELIRHEKNEIDLIIILTPTNQHALQVQECLSSGIPVICEKSLSCNSTEAMQIKKVLDKNKGFLAVIYNYLGYPMIRELKYLIEKGILGKIQHIQVEMPQEGFLRMNLSGKPIVPQDWRLIDGIIPTISLDLGVHLHMLVRFLTGAVPLNVVSNSQTMGNFPEIRDNVSCLIEYSNDMMCNMWFSKIAIGKRNGLNIRLYGKNGSAEWVQENPEYLNLADCKGHRWTIDRGSSEVNICNQARYTRFKAGHPAGFIEGYSNYYYDIESSFNSYTKDHNNFYDDNCFGIDESLEGLFLFEAVAKSSLTRSWEKVNTVKS